MKLLFRKIIQTFLGIYFFVIVCSCKNLSLENPCDPSSKSFQNTLIAKALLSDQSSYCSLSSSSSNTQVTTPTFTPSAGHYSTAQNIRISTTTASASIYYTTDGNTPTTSSTSFTTAFHIWGIAGKTIQAIATKAGLSNSSVLNGVFSYPPLQTEQTTIYQSGDDGTTQLGTVKNYTGPTAHSTYTSDYTTTDNSTGLVWASCPQGRSDSTCSTGTTQTLANDGSPTDATNHSVYGCSVLNSANSGNGYSGIKTWRLPTRYELETLVNYAISAPTLNQTAFPNNGSTNFWTSTANPLFAGDIYLVNFIDGSIASTINSSAFPVRCVSGTATNPALQYTDNGDGTIKDKSTGLLWQKCSVGQNNDSTCSGVAISSDWTTALTNCNSLSLTGKTWRLPNLNELKTLVDTSINSGPTISVSFFPSTQAAQYWSSTTHFTITTNAWYVNFSNNSPGPVNKITPYHVRCVAGP